MGYDNGWVVCLPLGADFLVGKYFSLQCIQTRIKKQQKYIASFTGIVGKSLSRKIFAAHYRQGISLSFCPCQSKEHQADRLDVLSFLASPTMKDPPTYALDTFIF